MIFLRRWGGLAFLLEGGIQVAVEVENSAAQVINTLVHGHDVESWRFWRMAFSDMFDQLSEPGVREAFALEQPQNDPRQRA